MFIPHTDADRAEMLRTIGVEKLEDLFEVVPAKARFPNLNIPPSLTEMEAEAELGDLAGANESTQDLICFLGAGAYHHYTPAAVDEGMTAYCGGQHADADALALADMVLAAVGETIRLSEDLLDAVTAVSGTGPAYVFLLAEALTEAAIREGLPHHAAEKLVIQTLRGAGALLSVSDKSAFRLRAEVTSPGGTTAAAMHVLEEGGFRALLETAVRSAAQRSEELGAAAIARAEESTP